MDEFSMNAPGDADYKRRDFIASALRAAFATSMVGIPVLTMASKHIAPKINYSVQDIIDIILKEIPGAPFAETVDTIKSGSAGQHVTGIVTTMFPTLRVIKEAARIRANFIIAHEPTFYNHADDLNWTEKNKVVKNKIKLLDEHHITVWRFHDYIHSMKQDGIRKGVLEMAGWQQYEQAGEPILKLPKTSLKNLIDHLKSSLHITHVKVIGDLAQLCERVALMPGAVGGQKQISMVEKEVPDVLIVGEVHEWETAEYIRDARAAGSPTSLIILGHSVSEEPGMKWFAEWLQPKIPGIKITHVGSGDPFTWI
ncbi:MAG: Nif3-like dinuclear metal center hexameric protein [Ginsengibacter sp.]